MGLDFWTNRNVFVTGATGLLGSAMVEQLTLQKARVTCLVRDHVARSRLMRPETFKQVNFVYGALEDFPLLVRAINEHEINTVFHLGAQTIVGTAERSALSTFESNVRGTWNMLEACRQLHGLVERVIVASSDKAYGDHARVPYTEDLPPRGRFPYDASKACAELVAMSYFHTYGVPLGIARCGNLFGPGDLNFNRLIPGTIRSALSGQRPVIRSNGRYLRDYLYLRDAVRAYLTLAESLHEKGVLGEAFNFGNETPVSVLDVVQTILEIMGQTSLEAEILDQASHEIRTQYLDCRKARQTLNWQPQFTLREGMEETVAWYRQELLRPCEES